MTHRFKVGDWVVRKKEHLDHPFWHKVGSTPVQITHVYLDEDIAVSGSSARWWQSFFQTPCPKELSTNLEDYL